MSSINPNDLEKIRAIHSKILWESGKLSPLVRKAKQGDPDCAEVLGRVQDALEAAVYALNALYK